MSDEIDKLCPKGLNLAVDELLGRETLWAVQRETAFSVSTIGTGMEFNDAMVLCERQDAESGPGWRLIRSGCPDWSGSLKPAWKVVEHFNPDQHDFNLRRQNGQWRATFFIPSYEFEAWGATAPEAICRAALKLARFRKEQS